MRRKTQKLVASIDPALKARFDQLDWGVRSPVLRALVKLFCDMHDLHGDMAIGIIMSGDIYIHSDRIVASSRSKLEQPTEPEAQ